MENAYFEPNHGYLAGNSCMDAFMQTNARMHKKKKKKQNKKKRERERKTTNCLVMSSK